LFGSPKGDAEAVWQDREIRFDAHPRDLELRKGEEIVEVLEPVEDTKGNNGEHGEMRVTVLRLLWVSKKSKRTNISIGWNCVTNINIKEANSRLQGKTQAIFVLTKYHNQRFEFIFTNLVSATMKLFTTIMSVYRAYDGSRLYRDLKLRGALIQDRELKLLPTEQTYSRVNGVWNLSSEQGNLGTFFISNVRVVWYANLAENFNVSMPYLQIKAIRVRDSKFGQALVIETTPQSGSYVLGFKVDPKETLDYVYKEITSLWKVYVKQPIFGVEVRADSERQLHSFGSMKISEAEADVEIVDAADKGDLLAMYYADATKGADRDPVYNPELGLAVEQLKEGLTIEQLWSVL